MNNDQTATAEAIRQTLISPNETDQNLEAANVVDGLFAIARAISSVAGALRDISESLTTSQVGDALAGLASINGLGSDFALSDAIKELADALKHDQR